MRMISLVNLVSAFLLFLNGTAFALTPDLPAATHLLVAPDVTSSEAIRAQPPEQLSQQPSAPPAAASNEYTMAAGDHIHLVVYGEEDLSGDYVVGDTGFVALPLIGNIMASGLNKHQVEEAIRMKLAKGYLNDPKVSIQLLNYRPFFILGEVAKPGSYPYVDGMNVLNAVALAGGYTYRASTSRIKIIHAKDLNKTESNAQETETVAPGDIIKVPERYF